jgi:hypothetical protein
VHLYREGNCIRFEPVHKDLHLARRIAPDSAHPLAVHKAWPRMLVRRAERLSWSDDLKRFHRQKVVSDLGSQGIHINNMVKLGSPKFLCKPAILPRMVLWLPVPFHPLWENLLRKTIVRFMKDLAHKSLISLSSASWCNRHITLKLAWANAVPSNLTRLQL